MGAFFTRGAAKTMNLKIADSEGDLIEDVSGTVTFSLAGAADGDTVSGSVTITDGEGSGDVTVHGTAAVATENVVLTGTLVHATGRIIGECEITVSPIVLELDGPAELTRGDSGSMTVTVKDADGETVPLTGAVSTWNLIGIDDGSEVTGTVNLTAGTGTGTLTAGAGGSGVDAGTLQGVMTSGSTTIYGTQAITISEPITRCKVLLVAEYFGGVWSSTWVETADEPHGLTAVECEEYVVEPSEYYDIYGDPTTNAFENWIEIYPNGGANHYGIYRTFDLETCTEGDTCETAAIEAAYGPFGEPGT